SWMETIRLGLLERDQRERAHAEMIEQYRRLAQQTVTLKERNAALLKASHSTRSSAGASASSAAAGGSSKDNAVQSAFITSLEAQLAQTRADLSEQYKIQSTNAQRLLVLTDNLRDAEERGREERDELRRLRNEVEGLRERAKWHQEIVTEKERQIVFLQDEHQSLNLELNQITIQNQDLKTDNASLLQRWIEAKNSEAERMND
ncbi:autophagy-related protein 16, partial [Leucosporidium creatinivorum]